MRLDDLVGRAAADVRERAELLQLDLDEWRRRRARRGVMAVAAFGLVLVAGVALGSMLAEDDDLAVDDTLPPEVVTTTTTTQPGETTTTVPGGGEPERIQGIRGAGWERLAYGPLTGGRYRMAATWTDDDRLFVWGGHLTYSQETPPSSEFLQDGYLYDPATEEWTATGVPPLGQCHLGLARAIPVAGGVIVHGSVSVGGLECPRAARYDLESGTWTPIESELFERVSSLSPLAHSGEVLVAPGAGLAYDLGTAETLEIPRLPSDAAGDPPGQARAHWTGSEIIVVGWGPTYSWAPGDEAWTEIEGPPIPVTARDSVMTNSGLLAVDYQMAAAFYVDGEWERHGDLPLRIHECLPEAVSAAGTPVVRMCSGIALWDGVTGHWVPIPLEDLTAVDRGTLVGADGTLYSVGRSLRRFEIERAADGSIELPPAIPIGVMQLDLPEGWDQLGSIAPDRGAEGLIPDDSTVGVALGRDDGTVCVVTSTYGYPARLDPLTAIRPIQIHRPGRTPLSGIAYRQDDPFAIVYAFADENGTDTVLIDCSGPDDGVLSDAATEFAVGLWSPWEAEPAELEEASLVVTPQAGPRGTVVTLQAHDFPSGWSEWWLIDEDGNAVAEIPSDFYPHDVPDFTFSVAVDVSGTAGLSPIEIPPGTYRFAIDGQVVPGATFTKTGSLPLVDISYVFETGDGADPIGTVELENRDTYAVDLTGWAVVDEISPTSTFDFPDGTTIEPGGRIFVEYQRSQCPSPTEADFVVCTAPPRGAVRWDSVVLVENHGHVVDRVLLSAPCPWEYQPESPDCGYVLFHDPERGIGYQVPADSGLPPEVGRWHIADLTLTPNLAGPLEILSLGTYPLRQGGDCAQIPENALEDLGPLDAFVSIQRRSGASAGGSVRVRPAEFTYEWLDEDAAAGFWECLDRPDRDELYLRWASFIENDRVYYLIVALGQQARDTVRADQVLRILNGLDFD